MKPTCSHRCQQPPPARIFLKQTDLLANDAGPLLEATRAQWAKTSRIETGDSLVQEVYDNARYVLPGIVSDNGVDKVGLFQYPAEWVRDDSQFSLGLTSAGHFELARPS